MMRFGVKGKGKKNEGETVVFYYSFLLTSGLVFATTQYVVSVINTIITIISINTISTTN